MHAQCTTQNRSGNIMVAPQRPLQNKLQATKRYINRTMLVFIP